MVFSAIPVMLLKAMLPPLPPSPPPPPKLRATGKDPDPDDCSRLVVVVAFPPLPPPPPMLCTTNASDPALRVASRPLMLASMAPPSPPPPPSPPTLLPKLRDAFALLSSGNVVDDELEAFPPSPPPPPTAWKTTAGAWIPCVRTSKRVFTFKAPLLPPSPPAPPKLRLEP